MRRRLHLSDLGVITSLDAPHRVFDAILRDSNYNGTEFMRSAIGLRLQTANMRNATALFEASPTALLFGAWNSTGEGGGFGAKFTRCIVSEIVASVLQKASELAAGSIRSEFERT